MGTNKKIEIEIDYGNDNYFHVDVNDKPFKFCTNYNELAECIGCLIKSCCKRNEP